MAHVLAKDLRAAVLQAGIQGKLTNQLNSDTSVKESLLDISTEKKKQIKEKLMKNEKLPSEIKESEITLTIPESWQFVRLGYVVKLLSGQDLTPDRYSDKPNGIPYITGASNFYDGSIVINRYTLSPTSVALKGDLLITCKGTVGELAYLKAEKAHIARQIMSISTIGNVNLQYVELLLRNFIETLKAKAKSIIPGIDRKTILNLVVPFPPIEEQQRIVDRVDELMAKIDEYEKLENQLVQLKEQFPKDMRDSLLQAGMMGKLTEQLANDTSVESTLKYIEQEKQQLIKDKKSKKTKRPTEDFDEEVLFDIPSSWKWVKFGDLFSHVAGKALNSKNTTGTKVQYLTTSNVYEDHFELENLKEMYYTEEEIEKYSVKRGDLLVLEGGDTGRSAIWPFDKSYCIQNHLHRCRPYGNINVQFYLQVLRFLKNTGVIKGKGIAIQGLSANVLHNILVPLPPIDEQQRIVDKLDEMLPLVDALAQMD